VRSSVDGLEKAGSLQARLQLLQRKLCSCGLSGLVKRTEVDAQLGHRVPMAMARQYGGVRGLCPSQNCG
jgi:hypothetical protein